MFFESMDSCPRGQKVLLLGKGGVPTIAIWHGNTPFWIGWAPIPDIPPGIRELQFQSTSIDSNYDERFD